MLTVLLGMLALLVLVKAALYLLRWYEVSDADGVIVHTHLLGLLTRLGRGAWPFFRECLATLLTVSVWLVEMPYRLITRPLKRPFRLPSGDGLVVVLIHGFSITPWSMVWIGEVLRRRGRRVVYLDYHPGGARIEQLSGQLAMLMDQLGAQGVDQVDLVGHSMGGLIGTHYVAGHPGRVRRMVALGTPFGGTRLWAMSIGGALPQMRPGSDFLTALHDGRFPGTTRVTSIYTDFDQIVLPYRASHLAYPGAHNVELTGLGHNALLWSGEVARRVRVALERV